MASTLAQFFRLSLGITLLLGVSRGRHNLESLLFVPTTPAALYRYGWQGLARSLDGGLHLISIPVTNTSVNPARSTGVAVFAGGWALAQLWLFWVAPIIGAALGAFIYRFIAQED